MEETSPQGVRQPAASTKSERADADCAGPMGRGATATMERLAASLGKLDEAAPRFCRRARYSQGRRIVGSACALTQRALASQRQVLSSAGRLLRSEDYLSASGLHGTWSTQVGRGAALLRTGRVGQIAGSRPRPRSAHLAYQAQAFG